MNNDFKTNITVNLGFELDLNRPITTYTESIQDAKCAHSHSHPRGQVIACRGGIMKVVTPNQIWIINPSQCIWLASNVQHQVFFPDRVMVISAFIHPSRLNGLPTSSFAFDSSEFFWSLLNKINSFSNPQHFTKQQLNIVDVFLDELATIEASPTFLPTSNHEKINTITHSLMANYSSNKNIEHYAQLICVSSRTLSRLFKKELGMSFGEWKIRLKMLEAIKQLGENKSIKEIAYDLGYDNSSSFIATFKHHTGKTPGTYIQQSQ
ncbi:helix-turn-helix domain-containing protein [Membranihabitans marinus]|uniref:helix-turn-helix domain-containing protein n=1 Tax=Membranihabitans marinus TaxID=1227546 RepID=UPI001F42BE0C|nr:AraC family transcriptional regulator [Membranihabitans marinus]